MRFAALLLVLLLSSCAPTGDTTFAGRFSSVEPVALTNLTLSDGRYRISYSMRIYIADQSVPRADVVCAVTDVSGRLSELPGLVRLVPTNQWILVAATDVFELPDLTIGIRCSPDRPADLTVSVRDLMLTAEPVD